MAYENTGYLAFANALSNAGEQFGNALTKRSEQEKKQQYLMDLAPLAKTGDWNSVAEAAFKFGDVETGMAALNKVAEEKKVREQRAFDANAFSLANGTGGAPAGANGGVTPNPTGQPMNLSGSALSRAIIGQESGGNPNIGKSVNGAMGIGQILPDTFRRYAKPGEDINNPADNLAVSQRMTDGYLQKYGDPARAAVAYFSGEGNVSPPGSPTPWKRDAKDGNGKSVSSYVSDVLGRMNKGVQVADASGAVPASAIPGQPQPQAPGQVDALMSRRQNIMRALSQQGISDNARAQLNTLLKDTEFQIERIDKQANNPANKIQNDIAQRGIIGEQNGLTGDDLTRFKLTGNMPSKSEKAPTEGQAKAARYSTVMADANDILSNKADAQSFVDSATGWTGRFNRAAEALPGGIGHGLESEAYQRFASAKESFLTAKLRDDSGATIGSPEYIREEKAMFPVPGDSQKVIEEKAQRRKRAIEAMSMEAAATFQDEFKQRIGGKSEQPSSSTNQPGAVDHLSRARQAIADGIPRDQVIKTLRTLKVDPSGL